MDRRTQEAYDQLCPGARLGRNRTYPCQLGGGERSTPATLQIKADGVFISVRGYDLLDITQALDALPAQLARLDMRYGERRLVYAEGTWRIDP